MIMSKLCLGSAESDESDDGGVRKRNSTSQTESDAPQSLGDGRTVCAKCVRLQAIRDAVSQTARWRTVRRHGAEL